MFSAILILLLLPITDVSRSRGMQFRTLSKVAFYVFVANFLILMQLGAKHVESPFIELGQISTVLYFLYFTVVMYSVTLIENSLVYLSFTSLPLQSIDKGYTNVPLQSGGPNVIYACAHIWEQAKKLRLYIFILVVVFLLITVLSDPILCDGPDGM
jgi:ubiquinol-cytochrome c reductase cytochrome b subunit